MQTEPISLTTQQMVTLGANLLNQHFLAPTRADAKRLFRSLEAGEAAALKSLKTENGGIIRIEMTLDATAFNGQLRFSTFRDGIISLLLEMSEAAKRGEEFQTFAPLLAEGQDPSADSGLRVFALGGYTLHDEQVNLLMMGAQADPENPLLRFRLMYIDPTQFQAPSTPA